MMDNIYDYDDLDTEDEDYFVLDALGDYDDEDGDSEEDEMLGMLMGDLGEADDDLSERKRRGSSRRSRRKRRRRNVRTAPRGSSYKRPVPKKFVTHQEFKQTVDLQDKKILRNGSGIKTINTRLNGLNGRVDGVVTVNTVQSKHIRNLNKQMKIDGALEFAESYDGTTINLYQLLKGAVKSGMVDSSKGAFSNPMLVGGLGFLLRNPGILGQFTGAAQNAAISSSTP